MIETSETLVVGTDEAGYGPNLGPLLVGASVWTLRLARRVSISRDAFRAAPSAEIAPRPQKKTSARRKKKAPSNAPTLFDALDERDEPSLALAPSVAEDDGDRIFQDALESLNASLAPIGGRKGVFPLVDSKKLYGASKSLAALERPFWLALASCDESVSSAPTFRSVLQRVAREEDADDAPPWERGVDFPTPIDPKSGDMDAILSSLETVRETFRANGVALLDVAARRVQPREFNRAIERLGLKSDLIADATLSTLVEALRRATNGSRDPRLALALCDKLGGRDRYASIVSKRFDGADVRIVRETREVGIYRVFATRALDRFGAPFAFDAPLALELRFTAKGESNAPTALASIVAKYLRELSMRPFNEFWRREVGETLAPTAGYPVDAARFRADVAEARERLGIDDEVFWRER